MPWLQPLSELLLYDDEGVKNDENANKHYQGMLTNTCDALYNLCYESDEAIRSLIKADRCMVKVNIPRGKSIGDEVFFV